MSEGQKHVSEDQEQMPEGQEQSPQNLFLVAPQLLVRDVEASAEYYRDYLGFDIGDYARMKDEDPVFFCMASRDGLFIQLRRAAEGHGESNRSFEKDSCDVYFFVKDVGALHRDFLDRGAKVLSEPEDKFYQMREMDVQDLDGYVIGFGEPIHEDHD